MAAKNGLRAFAYHVGDPSAPPSIEPEIASAVGEPSPRARRAPSTARLSPEEAARRYLAEALARSDMPALAAEPVGGSAPEFDLLGVEAVPLTGTRTVKFRQRYRKIPVYGSLVTVELGPKNALMAIASSLGEPDVDPMASVAPAEASRAVREAAHLPARHAEVVPVLNYYYDGSAGRWRLVYIFEDVPIHGDRRDDHADDVADFVVDAHDGAIVSELPRVHDALEQAHDGLGTLRTVRVIPTETAGRRRLVNELDNVHTYDFGFRSYIDHFTQLPGDYVEADGAAWSPAAISAHYNASAVAGFIRRTLRRDGVDGLGAPYRSSINCVKLGPGREWRNAAWLPGRRQMIYGQRDNGGSLRSYALALDIVAHEIFHGITDSRARLEYAGESGALNESLSDLFGIIVSNTRGPRRRRPDLWNWEMGEDLIQTGGTPLRDLSQPGRFGQPEHMDDYRDLPPTQDHGGVHTNSGIHNKAGFNLLMARPASGLGFVLAPNEVAALFYLAVTQYLGRTSGFSDSRRAVTLAARSLFRTASNLEERIAAIDAAYDAVGIAA